MALDTFTWCTQVQGNGGQMQIENNDREVVFGNGFRQVASSGYNTSRRIFTIVYAGRDWKEVRNFLDSHRIKPFAWTTPEGDLALFRTQTSTVATKVVSADVREVTCTIAEQFTSPNL